MRMAARQGSHTHDVVHSDIFYFEVSISDSPLSGRLAAQHYFRPPCVSVGLATEEFSLRAKQSGWDANSIGCVLARLLDCLMV